MEQLFEACAVTFILRIKSRILFKCDKIGVKHLLKARSVSCKELLRLMEPWFVVRIRHDWANSIGRLFIRRAYVVLWDKMFNGGILCLLVVHTYIYKNYIERLVTKR